MNANILCTLVSRRISPECFQLHGLDVFFLSAEFNTPENRGIVSDVFANYPALESDYLAEQQTIATAEAATLVEKTQAIINNLPSRTAIHTAIDEIDSFAKVKAFLHKEVDVLYWLSKNKKD